MTRTVFAFVLAGGLIVMSFGGCSGGGGGGGNEGVLTFTAAGFSVNEDGTFVVAITVHREGGSAAIGVTVTLTSGSATSPADYDGTSIVVAWLAGDLSDKTVTVPIVDDHDDEMDETLTLGLTAPTGGAVLGVPSTATVTIVDNDVAGVLAFSAPTYTYGEDGVPVGMSVTVMRAGGMDGAVSVTVLDIGGTANSDANSIVEPVDYPPLNATASFADQSTTPVMIMIPIVQDVLPELDEVFTVALNSPTNGATLGAPSAAPVTIVDDDPLLTLAPPFIFGRSVAKVGQRLAIGSGGFIGAVMLFDPSTAAQVDQLDGGPFFADFGKTLAIDGTTFAVGGTGTVRVYGLDPLLQVFTERFELVSALDGFGDAIIGLSDGRLVVGAPLAQGPSLTPQGGFGVYDALTGAQLQWIDGVADNRLGSAFALMGSELYVGAPGNDGAVLGFSGSPLVLNAVLPNPFPEPMSPSFGAALAVVGNDLFIGSPDSDFLMTTDTGLVTRYDSLTGIAVGSTFGQANHRYGARVVAVAGATAVQAPGAAVTGGRVFIDQTGMFLNDPAPASNGDFGGAMCEFDGVIVIAARGHNTVYIMKLP